MDVMGQALFMHEDISLSGFVGTQVNKSTNQTAADYSTLTAISWDQMQFNTARVWAASNPTKFVVPALLNGLYAVFSATVYTTGWSNANAELRLHLRKNGVINWLGAGGACGIPFNTVENIVGAMSLQCETQVVLLVTGDEYDVAAQALGDTAIDIVAARSAFSMYVVGGGVTGCLVSRTADLNTQFFNFTTITGWNSEVYDQYGCHDNVTNNGRITIPDTLHGRTGIVRARIRCDNAATAGECAGGILRNALGFSASWREIGIRASSTGSAGGGTSVFLEMNTQPHVLTAGHYYEIQLRVADTSVDLIAAYCTFGLEILPGFQGAVARINADLSSQNYSAGSTLSFNGADLLDTDSIHDPSGTPTQMIVPAALNGGYAIFQGHVYVTQSVTSTVSVNFQRDTGGGASLAYNGVGSWGAYATNLAWLSGRTQLVGPLVTGHKYTMVHYNSDPVVSLEEEATTFSMRVLREMSLPMVRLDQQYLEVVDSGPGAAVRLDQQYAEVVDSGTPNVRLDQQYVEVITNN